jgi:hypothetical protein
VFLSIYVRAIPESEVEQERIPNSQQIQRSNKETIFINLLALPALVSAFAASFGLSSQQHNSNEDHTSSSRPTKRQNIIMAEETAPTETAITCPCGKSTVKTTAAPMEACVCHCFECRKMTQGMFGSKRIATAPHF